LPQVRKSKRWSSVFSSRRGVFRGSGVYTWVKLLCLFKANTEQRVVAFDFFETSREVEFRYAIDKECLEAHAEGWTSQEVLIANCKAWGFERLKLFASILGPGFSTGASTMR